MNFHQANFNPKKIGILMLTRKTIAKKLHLSNGHLSDLLNGKKSMTIRLAKRLSEITGIYYKDFIGMNPVDMESVFIDFVNSQTQEKANDKIVETVN